MLAELQQAHGEDRARFLELDLASLDSVRRAAQEFLSWDLPLDVLINNAGLAGSKGTTKEGFELHFGVNHLGHFLLTLLLFDHLRHSGTDPRIVHVASRAHTRVPDIDWDALKKPTQTLTGFPEYSVSKLANVLFNAELARHIKGSGVHTYALHPGVVASDIWRKLPAPIRWLSHKFMLTNAQGALTTLYCATSPACAKDQGLYYSDCHPIAPSKAAQDQALAATLWEKSLSWTQAPDLSV